MNFIDRLICELDTGLRTVLAPVHAQRVVPFASTDTHVGELAEADRRQSIALMRVNHAGEVCAQALYQGQALVARKEETRELLERAAHEERDHLSWCGERLRELGGRTSGLTPLFYAGSFTLGVASGLLGDRWSMGFLVETERQVEAHLDEHLDRLPAADSRSRDVLVAMRADEVQHAQTGLSHGAISLPLPAKAAMRGISKVMTGTTYWV
ncbi:MAG TPA: 2-polyprenyl-3-methyl-6-methoxy-1,4-benzoquinone monooxygenase [Usitatibacteraceae bacterium]